MTETSSSEEDPIKNSSALKAFDKCYILILEHADVDVMMIAIKCVRYGVLERSPISGAAEYQTNRMKMEMLLTPIRQNIGSGGVEVFYKLVRMFQSMGNYTDLAVQLEGTIILRMGLCTCTSEENMHYAD